jgi:hypothetical protein
MDAESEFFKALELVAKYDSQKPLLVKEFRLYYNKDDGTVLSLWETNHPDGTNYIVLDDVDFFYRNNTHMLRVIDGKLKLLKQSNPYSRLVRSSRGQPVVKGYATLALNINEQYPEIEYYDRKTNN